MAPQRTCVICRKKGDQSGFVRFRSGINCGRSAYFCTDCLSSPKCISGIERAWRKTLSQAERADILARISELRP